MTTKHRRGAAKKKQALITMPGIRPIPAGEVVGRYIETLQRDAAATGNRGPLDAYYQKIANALAKSPLEHPRRVHGGNITAKIKLGKRDARVALIRERFPRQPDRAACKTLRRQVETLLIHQRHVPPKNHTSQIDEIVKALVLVT